MEKIFYILHDNKTQALSEMTQHVNLIDMLIAQSYIIHQTGEVNGSIDADVITFANKNSIKVLALVTNAQFDPKTTHIFLLDPVAQNKALTRLIEECVKNHLNGVQFDFEMIPLSDKTALTQFYKMAAELFHRHGLIVSFAIAPTLMDKDFASSYLKKLYQVWQGAYDFKILGTISDFVTIMAYDQHVKGTTPGPSASITWDEQVIKHALEKIPANKISLGIPTYSGFWYMTTDSLSNRMLVRYDAVDFSRLQYILNKYQPKLLWDDLNKVNYTFYEIGGINRYIFIEDAQSFAAKYALAKKYDLRGISVFRLGIEDPAIWEELKNKPWWKFW